MPIITIKNESPSETLVWKHPERQATLGSQIIVDESEEALIFENGQHLLTLQAGRHLLESGNIPGLENLIKNAFNKQSPIYIEICFVKKIVSFEYKWGSQIKVMESNYGLLIPLGGYGSYSLRIKDSASLIIQIIGGGKILTIEDLKLKLLPIVERNLKDTIAETLVKKEINIFNIDTKLVELSEEVMESLKINFERFGLDLIDFYIQGLSVIENDPTYIKFKASLAEAASLKVRAQAASESGNFYQVERSYDALNKAAENEGGLAGTFLSGGLGLGLGANAGQQMSQAINENTQINSTQSDKDLKEKLKDLKDLLDSGLISSEDYNNKKNKLIDKF